MKKIAEKLSTLPNCIKKQIRLNSYNENISTAIVRETKYELITTSKFFLKTLRIIPHVPE